MNLFYQENINFNQKEIFLSKEESKHLLKTLRKQIRDIIHITDGKGNLFETKIYNPDFKKCELKIIRQEFIEKQKPEIHIAISPTKNDKRLEWFVEKATEIGISEITPLICKRSEKQHIKIERLKKITVSAIKQSQQFYLPIINKATDFQNFIKQKTNFQKFIAHCEEEKNPLIKLYQKEKSALILIGPEGDFTNEEIELALENNFQAVDLGNTRLRTETAGIVALVLLRN